MKIIKKFARWETALVLILVLEIVVFGSINPRFLRVPVLLNSFSDFACVSIIALFVTMVLITGGMDISSGSIIGLTSIVIGMLWKFGGINIWIALPISLLVGVLCGAFNGFLIAYTGVQAMVVTLGTSFLYSGLSLVLIGLSGTSAFEGIGGYPDAFVNIGNGSLIGKLPNPMLIFIILTIAASILVHFTKYGRQVFLVGINRNAAIYSGIPAKKIIMSVYVISGFAASLAGILLTSYIGSSRSDLGAEITLSVITVVVLGGTAITGGKGTIIGTALAGLVVAYMQFGLQMAGISTQYISVFTGLLLVVAASARGISGQMRFRKKS